MDFGELSETNWDMIAQRPGTSFCQPFFSFTATFGLWHDIHHQLTAAAGNLRRRWIFSGNSWLLADPFFPGFGYQSVETLACSLQDLNFLPGSPSEVRLCMSQTLRLCYFAQESNIEKAICDFFGLVSHFRYWSFCFVLDTRVDAELNPACVTSVDCIYESSQHCCTDVDSINAKFRL
ncbi:hypothetical protein NPIL_236201 [Nephila pilipes]|uniref:Uncharacterized protein n=1 Tax=Nephila pilipes TaxID=299642 RepID=A0A8X6TFS1_NEPPI|nr:hypothetical protein NPIL_236201 [Nephila pilipes]